MIKHQAEPQIHKESHTLRCCHLQRVPSSGMSSVMGSMNHLQCSTISRSDAPSVTGTVLVGDQTQDLVVSELPHAVHRGLGQFLPRCGHDPGMFAHFVALAGTASAMPRCRCRIIKNGLQKWLSVFVLWNEKSTRQYRSMRFS
jgi:hypothetical protein